MAPGDVMHAWRKLPRHDKMKVAFSGVLLMWAMALSADMYYLKQRQDFKKKFNVDDAAQQPQGWWSWAFGSKEPEQEEEPEWRRAVREREAPAAAAAAAQVSQQPAQQATVPATKKQ